MKNRLPMVALFLLGTAVASVAESNFDRLVSEILANDLTLKGQSLQRASEVADMRADNILEAPEVEFEHLWSTDPAVHNKLGLSVTQSFDWPGLYSARNKAAYAAVSITGLLDEIDFVNQRVSVGQALIDVVYTRRRLDFARRQCELFDSLLSKYDTGYRRGEFSRLDYTKVGIESVKAHRDYVDVSRQWSAALASLSALNGGKPVGDIVDRLTVFPDQPFLSLADYQALQQQNNPVARLSSLEEDFARINLDIARKKLLPQISLGYRYTREEATNFHGLSVGFTMPFIYGSKAKLRSSHLEVEAAQARSLSTAVELQAQLSADYNSVLTMKERYDAMTSVAAIAECREMLLVSLHGGQISLIEFLNESNYYNTVESEILEFEYQYNLALIRLNRYLK